MERIKQGIVFLQMSNTRLYEEKRLKSVAKIGLLDYLGLTNYIIKIKTNCIIHFNFP